MTKKVDIWFDWQHDWQLSKSKWKVVRSDDAAFVYILVFLGKFPQNPKNMGRRSINTTKSGKYMNPTDQARKYSF